MAGASLQNGLPLGASPSPTLLDASYCGPCSERHPTYSDGALRYFADLDVTALDGDAPAVRMTRLVLDWDGTVTERDTLSLVMERYGDIALWGQTGRAMGHTMTHDE